MICFNFSEEPAPSYLPTVRSFGEYKVSAKTGGGSYSHKDPRGFKNLKHSTDIGI